MFREINVIFHRNPCSFRYFTLFHKFNLPLVLGPVSGGLKPPKELRSYFKKERIFNKLRQFDNLLLKVPIYRKQYEKADQILITSNYINDIIPFISSKKSKVILETAVDLPSNYNSTNVNLKKCVDILFVGRLVRYKGAELILHALADLKTDDFQLHIIGDGPEKVNLLKITNQLNLEKHVIFHGQLPDNKVHDLYKQGDIFCFPTLKEAAGNVLLEAMSYSLPIITVNYGGPKDICPEAGSFKIQIDDINSMINELTNYLEKLIKDPDLRIKMGRANFEYCKTNYNWPIIEEKIIQIFQSYF